MDLKTLNKTKVPVNSTHVHFAINGMVYIKKIDKRITNEIITTGKPEDRPKVKPEDMPKEKPKDTLEDLLSDSNGDLPEDTPSDAHQPKDLLSDHHGNSTKNESSITANSTSEQTEQTGAIFSSFVIRVLSHALYDQR